MLYKIYRHRQSGQIIGFPIINAGVQYSLRAFKRKIKAINTEWNVFVHFTYNNAYLKNDMGYVKRPSSNDIRKVINNIKQFNRNKVRDYSKYERWWAIKLYYELRNQEFKYTWKLEFDSTGSRKYNPHFHMLIASPFYISSQKIGKWWGKGFIQIKRINSPRMAQKYVFKYMSKDTKYQAWQGKKWSTSRNIKKVKSKWVCMGGLEGIDYYKVRELQKEPVQNAYLITEILKEAKKNKILIRTII